MTRAAVTGSATTLASDATRNGDESRRGSAFERLCRRLVCGRLARLKTVRVDVREGARRTVLGRHRDHDDPIRIDVHAPRFWSRVATGGGLGAAEAWRRGEWSTPDLTGLLRTMLRDEIGGRSVDDGLGRVGAAAARVLHRIRPNTRRGSRRNIHAHYDIGNDLFALFLDETMTYSSAIFEAPGECLAAAQVRKLERLARMLHLEPGMEVLEIGTGWGSFALHAAGQHGCHVTTTTISEAQYELANRRVAAAGLQDRITILRKDYRDLDGSYDAVASIEMIEAVGHDFLPGYFKVIGERLRPGGRAAIQAISMPDAEYDAYRKRADFIQRYIFPGSCCPSIAAITDAAGRGSDLRLTALDDIGTHYAETLRRWRVRFDEREDEVRALGYDDAFIRLWRYYLAYCEAGFDERYISVAQLAFTRTGGGEVDFGDRPSVAHGGGPNPGAARVTAPSSA